uniref:Uncharacterized protein n=1 Tax=Aegilops tauschii subsp. strangulata TaxID=200361 RepID=A0A452ZQ55_AEGTS
MGRLKIFVVKEPVVAASCLIAGFGLLMSVGSRIIPDARFPAKFLPRHSDRSV